MRCRKVRSYLSAYCNNELSGRIKLPVSEHLSTCSTCRREEAFYRSMAQTARELDGIKASDDFNTKLLNRIAQERFAETRAKAYWPRPVPLFRWGQAIPAFVTTSLVILLAVVTFWPRHGGIGEDGGRTRLGVDDSYLTAQPIGSAETTDALAPNWSFADRIERTEKFNRLSSALVGEGLWHGGDRSSGMLTASHASVPAPYAPGYYRVRQIMRVYMPADMPATGEARRAY